MIFITKCKINYRSGTVNSNTVNSKFHLIRSYCEIFVYHFPNISCLKYTVNSNFHLIRSKTLSTNDFELTVPDLYFSLPHALQIVSFLEKLDYRSGTVNSKSFVGKGLLRIKWKFELRVYFKHGILGKL